MQMRCVCGCSVCSALQLSLCASQHLGSFHDAYHLQVLQVISHCNVYQTCLSKLQCASNPSCPNCSVYQTLRIAFYRNTPHEPLRFRSCSGTIDEGQHSSSCAIMQHVTVNFAVGVLIIKTGPHALRYLEPT